jgi:hypothetical protein
VPPSGRRRRGGTSRDAARLLVLVAGGVPEPHETRHVSSCSAAA